MGNDATVNRLFSPSSGWDVLLIKHHFTQGDADNILSILLGSSRYHDSLIWHYEDSVMSSCSLFLDNQMEFLAANSIAILNGFKFGKWCGLHPFSVESDATSVVSMINKWSHLYSSCGNIITGIISLMKDLGIPLIYLGKKGFARLPLSLLIRLFYG
ncbi:hypothetical protein Ddye_030837 [Dipteronia dyeriana]|uniref:RNase H type-1 domain-containing protein n=1 Tax=Dipteronia dyeriana TaxID=168575 RepID=A0AAD9WN42_9ROSI|nr:hypothetical protein Ddye_030837 [Dipteronia dyeriana]